MSKPRILLRGVRLAFLTLAEPKEFKPGDGKPRFSATGLFPQSDTDMLAAVEAAMLAAAELKWPGKGATALKGLRGSGKTALLDGNTKAEYDGFEDSWAIGAHAQANKPPRLLDGLKNHLPRDTPLIYSGCYGNLLVEFWGQDNSFGKRINASLLGVQFVKDCLLYTSPSPRDKRQSRMPSSA